MECAGDPAARRRARRRGERRDSAAAVRRARFATRAEGRRLTAFGLLVAWAAVRWLPLDRQTAVGLTLVAIGSGLSAAAAGAVRSAGRGARLKWLAAGAAAGTLLAVLR